MLQVFLKTAFRRFRRQRGYFLINVVGLGLGMVCCLLIAIWVRDELSYDGWIEDDGNVYRVIVTRSFPNETTHSAATPRPLASALSREFPEIMYATRISRERAERVLVSVADARAFEEDFYFADPNVFHVLSYELLSGSRDRVLNDAFSLVLSESSARRYFGSADPVGETVSVRLNGSADFVDYTVTGVMLDPPEQSHIRPEFLATYLGHPLVGEEDDGRNWGGLNLYTYIRVRPGVDEKRLDEKIPAVVEKYVAPIVEEEMGISYAEFEAAGNRFVYNLQPVSDIHLTAGLANEAAVTTPRLYVVLFSVVALFVLLLACFNFVNLAMANAYDRSQEIAVRKSLGSSRRQLIGLELAESTLMSLIAGFGALWAATFLLPAFERLSGKELTIDLWGDPLIVLAAGLFAGGVGVAAGLFPAVELSRIDTAKSLKGTLTAADGGRSTVRSGLVIVQFTVAIGLIASTLVVDRQMAYATTKPLGYDREQVVLIEGTEILRRQMESFKNALRANPNVLSVANTQSVPGDRLDETDIRIEGMPEENSVSMSWMTTNAGFVETMGISVVEGRSFKEELAGDSMAVMLNETAVEALALDHPIGDHLVYENRRYEIIGVVGDYHFDSLHETIRPLVLFGPDPFNESRPNLQVAVRVASGDFEQTLNDLRETWARFEPFQPMRYTFLDEVVDRAYRSDRQTGNLLRVFAVMAILIASLGLVGLASLMAQRRTKEIGIRRVLGASVTAVVAMLTAKYARLVVVAFVIASPAAYAGMHIWLENFAYRVEIPLGAFFMAGLGAVVMAVVSVGFHSVRVGLSDPVKSLRHD